MEQYYNLKDAARLCGIKVRTIREWVKVGKIKAEKQNNDWYWMIPGSEIERINDANKH